MEWGKKQQQHQQQQQIQEGVNGGNMFVKKVMTDEQIELLRRQIMAYAIISEQLLDWHKSLTCSFHDFPPGVRVGNPYCDPSVTSAGHKITGRHRWNPTPVQLQILERIFDEGNGTPNKQKIKEITAGLSQHGQINEQNVYNWFQNRRARFKRKRQAAASNNAESEVESPNNKKIKPDDLQRQPNPALKADDQQSQNPEISTGMHSMDPRSNKAEPTFLSEGSSKPAGDLGSTLSDPISTGMDHLLGKMDAPGSYNPYLHPEDTNMTH